jgi:hypothetical protein
MEKLFSKFKKRKFNSFDRLLIASLCVVVFQISIIVLATLLTLQNAKVILLTLLCVMCVLNLKQVLYIKLK